MSNIDVITISGIDILHINRTVGIMIVFIPLLLVFADCFGKCLKGPYWNLIDIYSMMTRFAISMILSCLTFYGMMMYGVYFEENITIVFGKTTLLYINETIFVLFIVFYIGISVTILLWELRQPIKDRYPINCEDNVHLKTALEQIKGLDVNKRYSITSKIISRSYHHTLFGYLCSFVGIECQKYEHIQYDPDVWQVAMKGLKNTPYEGGTFIIDMKIPPNFPCWDHTDKPIVTFVTKMYHPVIDMSNGYISRYYFSDWKMRTHRILDFFRMIDDVIAKPNLNTNFNPCNEEATILYKHSFSEYNKEVQRMTKLYAVVHWTPNTHSYFDVTTRNAIRTFMLCRQRWNNNDIEHPFCLENTYKVLSFFMLTD